MGAKNDIAIMSLCSYIYGTTYEIKDDITIICVHPIPYNYAYDMKSIVNST